MNTTLRPHGVWLAILVVGLLTGCGTTKPAGSGLTPDIRKETLANGLDVYLLEDHSAPIATFQYWVKVGSADESEGQPGITGLSHFFEHMMFRGTPKYPDYFKAVSGKGAQLNAFTWLDVTVYWEKFASEHLDFILDIESDRLANMTIDLLNLEPEREVVKSERLLRTENSASGSLNEAVGATVHQKHSYHWPTVGWMRDLNAITIEQARAYHGRFYVPNNAYIVLVGDFDTESALDKVRSYFGKFPAGAIDRPERTPEPPQTRTRRTWVAKPTATGLLNVSYRSPAGGHPDFVVLEVIEAILTKGRSSRVQKSLVYGESPVAKSVSPFLFPFRDPGVMQFELDLLPGVSNLSAEERLEQVISAVRDQPVSADELERAVAQLRADIVRGMTTTQSRAQLMGFSIRATGDPALPWKRLEQYGSVTAADVARVAREWLAPERRVIGHAVTLKQLASLAQQLVAAWPGDSKVDGLLPQAVAYAIGRRQWRQEQAAIEMESQAIEMLQQRADREKAALGSDEKSKAIDAYLATADQGVAKRKAAVAAKQDALAAMGKQLDQKRDELMGALRKAKPTMRSGVAQRLISGPGRNVRRTKPPQAAGAELAEWALQALGDAVLWERPDAEDALKALNPHRTASPVLKGLYEFAHMVQRVDAGGM